MSTFLIFIIILRNISKRQCFAETEWLFWNDKTFL